MLAGPWPSTRGPDAPNRSMPLATPSPPTRRPQPRLRSARKGMPVGCHRVPVALGFTIGRIDGRSPARRGREADVQRQAQRPAESTSSSQCLSCEEGQRIRFVELSRRGGNRRAGFSRGIRRRRGFRPHDRHGIVRAPPRAAALRRRAVQDRKSPSLRRDHAQQGSPPVGGANAEPTSESARSPGASGTNARSTFSAASPGYARANPTRRGSVSRDGNSRTIDRRGGAREHRVQSVDQFEQFPSFMEGVEGARQLDERRVCTGVRRKMSKTARREPRSDGRLSCSEVGRISTGVPRGGAGGLREAVRRHLAECRSFRDAFRGSRSAGRP